MIGPSAAILALLIFVQPALAQGPSVSSVPQQTNIQPPNVDPDRNLTTGWLLSIMNERDRLYREKFDAQERAVLAALSAAKEAIAKSEHSIDKRLDGVNEFRGQLKDQQQTFLTRNEYTAQHEQLRGEYQAKDRSLETSSLERSKTVDAALLDISRRLDRLQGRDEGIGIVWAFAAGFGGLLLGMIGLGLFRNRAVRP